MSTKKKYLRENAAGGSTSAGDISGFAAPFGTLATGKAKQKKKLPKLYGASAKNIGFTNFLIRRNQMNENFDEESVLAKLQNVDAQSNAPESVAFGLEDEQGNVVKVRVRKDQAEEFEAALGELLDGEQAPTASSGWFSGQDDSDHQMDMDSEGEVTSTEIAEIVYQLKSRFDIVDIQYPTVVGDEEEEGEDDIDLSGEEGAEGDDLELGDPDSTEGDTGDELDLGDDEGAEGDELDMEAGTDDMPGEDPEQSALQQVIGYLKADAESRAAEANAKKAEAEAESAKYAAQTAEARIKQEEQNLDMEDHFKKQKDKEAESKRLAKIAQYRREVSGAAQTEITATESMSFKAFSQRGNK